MRKAFLIIRASIAVALLVILTGLLLAPAYPKLEETRRSLEAFVNNGAHMVEEASKRIQARMGQSVEKLFSRLDQNGDGLLSINEFRGLELSLVASLDELRESLPALPSLDIDMGVDVWQWFKRFVIVHILVIVVLFIIENVRVLWDDSNPFPSESEALSRTPPHASIEDALYYDTPMTLYERIKMALFIVTLHVVVRVMLCVSSLVTAALIASVAGRHPRHTVAFQLLSACARFFGWGALIAMGFYHIRVFGKPSTDPRVKIVVGNHVCAIEVILLFIELNFPSFVSRVENLGIPLFGGVVRAADAIVVTRDAATSRQQTIEAIQARAGNPQARQIMIFPEGTCDNNRALFKFHRGAFQPGKPIQLVAFKYRYYHFNPAWTGRVTGGNDPLDLILRLFCQFVNRLDVKFVPAYHPTAEEQADSELYAAKCQRILANVLQCATSDATLRSYSEREKKKLSYSQ